MTYGQFLKQEGIQEGLQTGIANVTKNMLKEGLDPTIIQKVTGLNKVSINKLKPSKN